LIALPLCGKARYNYSRVVWLAGGQVGAQRAEGGILADTKTDIHLHDPLQEEILEDIDIEGDSRSCLAKRLLNRLLMHGPSSGSDDSVRTDAMFQPEMRKRIFGSCRGIEDGGG